MTDSRPEPACPCGTGAPLAGCCGPLLDNREQAGTAEQLMRSRYTAFALRHDDHLFRTWHPRTRPEDVHSDPGLRWTRLEVLDTRDGEPGDETGVVEFRAHHDGNDGPGVLHERSRFARRAGRWVYLDGDLG